MIRGMSKIRDVVYLGVMVKILELAIKASGLTEAAQEPLGRELLERIETLEQLRAEIALGIGELDARRGDELDVEDVIRQAREEHAKTTRADRGSTVIARSFAPKQSSSKQCLWIASLRSQ